MSSFDPNRPQPVPPTVSPVQSPVVQPPQYLPTGVVPKSRLVYILLAIFLGGLGIHNFYAGYTSKAVTQLLISVLSCFMLALVSSIWAIVDICTVTVDSDGIPFTS